MINKFRKPKALIISADTFYNNVHAERIRKGTECNEIFHADSLSSGIEIIRKNRKNIAIILLDGSLFSHNWDDARRAIERLNAEHDGRLVVSGHSERYLEHLRTAGCVTMFW